MAKLQIFVLALVLAQGYCSSISISNLPSQIDIVPETRPLPIPEPEVETPVCVKYVKLLLQAIIDKLSDIPVVNRPSPEISPEDEVLPEVGSPEDVPDVPTPEATNPCNACFKYINTLILSAEKIISKDFFGRVISKPVSSSGNSGPNLGSDIWYKYKEGYNNAVRKRITISSLK